MPHADTELTRPSAPRCHALLPCAGTGTRAGTDIPKQYQPIAGQPMVMHTLAALRAVARLQGCVVVITPDDGFWTSQPVGTTLARRGGATRAESVFNGLQALSEQGARTDDWVLVHDAARCLVTPAQVDALIDACWNDAVGGLLALPLPDTLKAETGGRVAATVERADKWLAQTPQMFRIGMLLDALERVGDVVTDEASAIETLGLAPLLVPGSAQNFKVTFPEDFALAEAVLLGRKKAMA